MAHINNCTKEMLQQIPIPQTWMKFTILLTMSILFICINAVMFVTLLSKPVLTETSRYILFAHILCNDSIQLLFSLIIAVITPYRLVKAVCSILILVTDSTSRITPLNLALMSLERYVAICFPLHHSEFATVRKTYVAIAALWFFGLVNPVVDSLYTCVADPVFFTEQVLCGIDGLFITAPWQELLYQGLNGLYYVAATLAIIYSYVCVMVVARSVSSDENSARKAHRTLLLHLIQLGLCLNTLLFGNIVSLLTLTLCFDLYHGMRYTIFLLVVLVPRCLSPLIYGLRDETLRFLFLHHLKCGLCRTKVSIHIHSLHSSALS